MDCLIRLTRWIQVTFTVARALKIALHRADVVVARPVDRRARAKQVNIRLDEQRCFFPMA